MTKTALIVVDMLSAYDFEGAEELVDAVEDALPQMKALVEKARRQGVPVVYVNDNYGSWRSDQKQLVAAALEGQQAQLVEPIVPDDEAMFVVKARHSIFYETPLEFLLRAEEIEKLVLVGQVTEQCILYSALDAHIRRIPVIVPRDAVAHIDGDLAEAALRMMELNMDVSVCDAEEVDFSDAGTSA